MSTRPTRGVAALAALLALACGGDELVHLPPTRGMPFDPASVVMVAGDSVAIGVSLAFAGAGARAVVTSAAPSIAEPSVGTSRGDGVLLYVRGKSAGTTTLTIEIIGEQTLTGTLPVVVTARPTPPRAISVSPVARTLGLGDTARLVATATRRTAAEDLRVTFHSRDTSVVAVDSAGLVTARRVGAAVVVAARVSDPRLSDTATITVVPAGYGDARLVVSGFLGLSPGAELTIHAALKLGPIELTREPTAFTYTSRDRCIADVSADGRVRGGRNGETQIVVASRDVPTQRAEIPASVRSPAVSRVTLQSIITGSPPRPVDLERVSGAITVLANVDLPWARRVEVRLGGRLVESAELVAASGLRQLAFVVSTAARDAVTGGPVHPNGKQSLTITVSSRQPPFVSGCPDIQEVETITQALTLANPTAAAGRAP